MQYTGYSLAQDASLDAIVAGLTGATGTEGVIISNHSDFTTKNTTYTTKNTSQDGILSSLETKATNLESGATGLENRNSTLNNDYLAIQNRESALIVGLTGTAGSTGLEARSVGFSNKIVAINNQLNGEIQTAINTKVADSIFDALTNEFTQDFEDFQTQLNQKVVTATQEALDARQDGDDAALEKKFCSVEEFAQTFQQTYTVVKTDNTPYTFDGKIQKVDKAPPIFSIVEKAQNASAWDLKIKLTDYGYNVMSGNLVVKNGAGVVVNTLTKSMFDATTKLYTLSLLNSNSSGSLINGPYTFEYRASTSTAVYELVLNATVLATIGLAPPTGALGNPVWGKWIGGSGVDQGLGISATTDAVYITGRADDSFSTPVGIDMGTKPGGSGNIDAFIIKFNLDGTALWGKWIGGAGNDQGLGISATTDAVYITGFSNDNFSTPSELVSSMGTRTGSDDTFIIKINSNGSIAWGKWIGGSFYDLGTNISVSSNGIYLTGRAGGNSSFSNPSGISSIMGTKPGSDDGFIIKLNLDGTLAWAKWIGGTVTDQGLGISATTDAVYVTGRADGSLTAPSGIGAVIGTKPGSIDGFIIKFNSDGTLAWAKWIGGSGPDEGLAISALSDSVYVTGYASGTLTAPSGIDALIGAKPGSDDIFVIKINSNGSVVWAKWIGGSGGERGFGISATSEGIYVTGVSDSNFAPVSGVDMGTKPGTDPYNDDTFIVKMLPTDGSISWAKWIGGSGSDIGYGISATSDSVYVTGYGDNTFTKPSGIDMGTKPGNYDAFILKYV